MLSREKSKLLSEKIFPEKALHENIKALEFYRTYREMSDVSEKIDRAMDRKQIYKYSSNSTQNCKINYHAFNH